MYKVKEVVDSSSLAYVTGWLVAGVNSVLAHTLLVSK